jgi:hypothetical protein
MIAKSPRFSGELYRTYEEHKQAHFQPSNCKHGIIVPELRARAARFPELFSLTALGTSQEGREIIRFSFGKGPVVVLLWSQMHGDEPTATLALMDIFSFLGAQAGNPWVAELRDHVTVHAIPMVNPDGAERFRRFTASGIDMNRDARSLSTPEARILREAQRALKPDFGFNLHDQGLSSVGTSSRIAAISLLAPAVDDARTMPHVRVRAARLAALIARQLREFVPGSVATYEDAYEPRAFGDGMQSWGTSTVLVESGQWPGDPEKKLIRKLNFVVILSALRAISDGSYQDGDLDDYHALEKNGKRAYDVIIRGVDVTRGNGGWSGRTDIGLSGVPSNGTTTEFSSEGSLFAVKEIGDLTDFGALWNFDASSRSVAADVFELERIHTLDQIRTYLQLP